MNVITPAAGPGTDEDTPPGDYSGRRMPVAIALAASLLCALLVAHRIGEHGFWFDEGSTIGTVSRPVGDALWRIFHWELNQSPYHLLALGWLRLVEGEGAMRALSAAFAVVSVPLAFVVGHRVVGARAAAIGALLLAVHPFAVQWGQQLRGYSLLVALTLVSTWLLVRLVERPGTGRAAAYGVVAALSLYAQMFSALVVAAHALAVALCVRPLPRRALFVAAAAGGLLALPMAEFFLNRDGDPLDWVPPAGREQVLGTAEALAGGGPWQLWPYAAVALAGVVVLVRRARAATAPLERFRSLLSVLLLVVPPAVAVLLSVTAKPLVEARFLIVVLPGLVLVAGAAVEEALRRQPRLAVGALAVLLVVSGLGLREWYAREPFDQWREAVAEVAATAEVGDIVLTSPSRAVHVVRHYADELGVPTDVGYPDDMEAADPPTVYELRRFDEDPSDGDRLRPEMDVWLADRYRVADEQRFAGVLVRRHEQR